MELCLLNFYINNGEIVSSCDFNSSILIEGPGIYEVLRVINYKPLFVQDHIQRFFNSAKYAKFKLDFDQNDILKRIKSLIEINKMHLGNIRFQFIEHPDHGNLFLAWATPYNYPSTDQLTSGVELISISANRENPHIKSANLPVRELSENLINEKQVEEILLVNDLEFITEGSRSNIFFIKENKVYTPKADLVLEGVTRAKIIKLATQNNVVLSEENIPLKEIDKFEACFLSSTSKSVLPVNQIDNINYEVSNDCMHKISTLYKELMANYLINFRW